MPIDRSLRAYTFARLYAIMLRPINFQPITPHPITLRPITLHPITPQPIISEAKLDITSTGNANCNIGVNSGIYHAGNGLRMSPCRKHCDAMIKLS